MEAYTAVISLLRTLDQPYISELFHGRTANALDSLRATAEYFHDVLEKASNKSGVDIEKIKSLEEEIRIVVSEAEDVVEMKISEIIKGDRWTFRILPHHDMLPVVEKMDTTKKQVMEILSHDADQILELTGASSMSDPMLSDQLKDDIVQGLDGDLEIIDKRLRGPTSYHFDIFVWVTISQEFRYRNVLLEALHCISKQRVIVNTKDYDKMNDSELADLVQKSLKGPRYLVVVDDIWSRDVWDSISQIFPNRNNGSRSSEVEDNPQTNHNHPLHLQASDAPGVALIPMKLTGPENYGVWSRSMRLALLVKNKLGFVDGTCAKSSYKGDLAVRWE
ncbi:hypothetical protein KY285_019209 [Solanum tuberosum]|nr:hypothetical protein KY285_019209 [Solanum tuberosum]